MTIIRYQEKDYKFPNVPNDRPFPIYKLNVELETVVSYFVETLKLTKDGVNAIHRKEMRSRMTNDPLQIEVGEETIVATQLSNTFIYDQTATPLWNGQSDPDEVQWSEQDTYQVLEKVDVVSLPKAYSAFEIERYKDNTHTKEKIDTNSQKINLEVFSLPSSDRGVSGFRGVVDAYQTRVFLLPALEQYASVNESLGTPDSSIEVETFLDSFVSRFFDVENETSLTPTQFDSEAPSLQSVRDYRSQLDSHPNLLGV
jgi:hypothetical protein